MRQVGVRRQAEQHGPRRRQPRVDALPERRVGGQRQQVRQILHQHVDGADRQVAVRHADMHVQAEEHTLLRQPGHLRLNPLVALRGKDGAGGGAAKRVRAAEGQVVTQRRRQVAHAPQTWQERVPHVVDVAAHAGLDLNRGLVELGGHPLDLFLRAGLKQAHGPRSQVARVAVEDLEFELHAHGGFRRRLEVQVLRRMIRRDSSCLPHRGCRLTHGTSLSEDKVLSRTRRRRRAWPPCRQSTQDYSRVKQFLPKCPFARPCPTTELQRRSLT